MSLVLTISLILFIVGVLEKRNHKRRLKKIPVRIHVNGTRGKSLLTRILAEIFAVGGKRVAAKVTGERPMVFYPSTGWQEWPRRGLPRIREQIRFVKEAGDRGIESVIVENMAVSPEILDVSEREIVRSGLSIFTNFRVDHQEQSGESVEKVTQVLSNALPRSGRAMLPEYESTDCFLRAARARKSEVIQTGADRLFRDQLGIFEDTAGLVKSICELYRLPSYQIKGALSDSYRFLVEDGFLIPLPGNGKRQFINLFSCNDVESSRKLVREMVDRNRIRLPYGIVLACREDRPLRSMAFLEWISDSLDWTQLIIVGCCPRIPIRKLLRKSERSRNAIRFFPMIDTDQIQDMIEGWDSDVLGLGNFVNSGERILSAIFGEIDGD